MVQRVVVRQKVQRRPQTLPKHGMLRHRIREERPDKRHSDTACHSRQSVRGKEIDGVECLSVGRSYLLPNLADLQLVADNHRSREDGDDADSPEAEHLDWDVEGAGDEDEEEYQSSCRVLGGNVPSEKADYHSDYSAQNS